MSTSEWEKLNFTYHKSFLGQDYCSDDPRWTDRLGTQSETILKLASEGYLSRKLDWLDWGCGDGKLANTLNDRGLSVKKFDRHMPNCQDYLSESELIASASYSVVLNTSVFEHIRERKTLDEIAALVNQNGALILHTLVTETIPRDPSWFYLLPVHCSFFSNKSMELLFEAWGFKFSIYHVPSRLWFCYKTHKDMAESKLKTLSNESDKCFFYKNGFMNYWGVYDK
jgi:2-polyprenyl-3-methyl-5-hydroxy-6-metoxy-1,4-benzoquinol methylase